MDPFTEIEVTPLYSQDGMRSQGKSVRLRNEDVPSGWSELGVVSSNYLLIHNSKLKGVVDEIAERSPIHDWTNRKLFFDGKRFVYSITSDSIVAEASPGDLVRFGLIGYNSYDGSRAVSVGMYAEHLVCSNGMTSETHFPRFTFRHHQGNIDWDEQTTKAFKALLPGSRQRLAKFASCLGRLKNKVMTTRELQTLRQEYLSDLSVNAWGRVVDRMLLHEEHTGFGLLDACTRVFWHNDRQTFADYRNNTYTTDSLINFSLTLQN